MYWCLHCYSDHEYNVRKDGFKNKKVMHIYFVDTMNHEERKKGTEEHMYKEQFQAPIVTTSTSLDVIGPRRRDK